MGNDQSAVVYEGPPLLVCFYSGGLNEEQGRETLKPLLDALQVDGPETPLGQLGRDAEIIPHELQGACDWSSHIDAVVARVNAIRGSRAVVILGHSHGAFVAYHLATRLPAGCVLKLFVVARRGPMVHVLDDIWCVSDRKAFEALDDVSIARGFCKNFKNDALERIVELSPGGSKTLSKVMAMTRCHYGRNGPALGSGEVWDDPGPAFPLSVPILALVAGSEKPGGETIDKVRRWSDVLISEDLLHVREVDDIDHMGILSVGSAAIPIILAELRQLLM